MATDPAEKATSWKRKLRIWIPENDENQFKIALYNVILFVFLGLGIAAITAVYFLLHVFLKPLLWAALCGTVLFPLKRKIASATKSWLRSVKTSEKPLIFGFACLPIKLLNCVADRLYGLLATREAMVLISLYPAFILLGRYNAFASIICGMTRSVTILDNLIDFSSGNWVSSILKSCFGIIFAKLFYKIYNIDTCFFCLQAYTFLVAYVILYLVWLWTQGPEIAAMLYAKLFSLPAWYIGFCIISRFFGPLRVFVFSGLISLVILSACGVVDSWFEFSPEPKENVTTNSSQKLERKSSGSSGAEIFSSSASPADGKTTGDRILNGLFAFATLLLLSTHLWMLSFLILPFVWMILKNLGGYFGLWRPIWDSMIGLLGNLREKFSFISCLYSIFGSDII